MRMIREYDRLPPRGIFRRIALRQGGWTGWNYIAEGRARDGVRVVGVGRNPRDAQNDLAKQRKP